MINQTPVDEATLPKVPTLHADRQSALQEAMSLFYEAPVPYLLLDAQGHLQDANGAACGLLTRSRDELLGQPLSTFLTPASRGGLTRLLEQVAASGLTHRGDIQLLQGEAAPSDVRLEVNARKRGEAVQSFRVVMSDLTGPGQGHAGGLDTAAAQVQALNQELEQVVNVFIRQLQLPVTRASNFLEITRRALDTPPDKVARPLQNTQRSLQQLTILLASVASYLQVRGMRVWLQTVNLDRVLRDVLLKAKPLLQGRDVQITHDPLPTVQGDSRTLFLVFEELLGNALKYTRTRDTALIHVRVHETDAEYVIGVQDNGVGFDAQHADRLFQLFGRLHPSTAYEGSGIGLVTVRRACERFGGRVWAEGTPDQGATVWMAWPKAPRLPDAGSGTT